MTTKDEFKKYAHQHTMAETEEWLNNQGLNLDIMYNNNGRPDCYDVWNGECAGVRCKNGILWN